MAVVASVPDKANKAPTGREQKAEALRIAAEKAKASQAAAQQASR